MNTEIMDMLLAENQTPGVSAAKKQSKTVKQEPATSAEEDYAWYMERESLMNVQLTRSNRGLPLFYDDQYYEYRLRSGKDAMERIYTREQIALRCTKKSCSGKAMLFKLQVHSVTDHNHPSNKDAGCLRRIRSDMAATALEGAPTEQAVKKALKALDQASLSTSPSVRSLQKQCQRRVNPPPPKSMVAPDNALMTLQDLLTLAEEQTKKMNQEEQASGVQLDDPITSSLDQFLPLPATFEALLAAASAAVNNVPTSEPPPAPVPVFTSSLFPSQSNTPSSPPPSTLPMPTFQTPTSAKQPKHAEEVKPKVEQKPMLEVKPEIELPIQSTSTPSPIVVVDQPVKPETPEKKKSTTLDLTMTIKKTPKVSLLRTLKSRSFRQSLKLLKSSDVFNDFNIKIQYKSSKKRPQNSKKSKRTSCTLKLSKIMKRKPI